MRKETKAMQIHSIIDVDSTVEGVYKTLNSARIDGTMVGNIYAGNTLTVGEKGRIVGNIYAATIIISGEVTGELHASEKVEVISTAKMYGDIYTPSIMIDEKAIFQGKCEMNLSNNEADKESEEKSVNIAKEDTNKEIKEEIKDHTTVEDKTLDKIETEQVDEKIKFKFKKK